MSLKINTEQLCSREIICRTAEEQPVELDYILPDYYPEIFRIIRCTAEPSIISSTINGDRLNYELCVLIRIIYCGTQGMRLSTIERKMTFSRSVPLEKTGVGMCAQLIPSADYINCRAVTGRRVDIHGAVGIAVTVTAESVTDAVSDVFGNNILLKKSAVICPSPGIYAEKRVTVTEEYTPDGTKPAVLDILRASAAVISSDKKIISGKLAAKGELKINILCTCSEELPDGGTKTVPEAMQLTVPYSHIMDMDGLDDRYETRVDVTAESCSVRPKSDGSGEGNILECEIMLLIRCAAERYEEKYIASDEFSTSCATGHEAENIKLSKMPVPINQTRQIKGNAEYREGNIDCIYDAWCEVISCRTSREEDGSFSVSGKAVGCIMACSTSGEPVICTADMPFTFEGITPSGLSSDAYVYIKAAPVSCSYNLVSDNSAEIKAELKIWGEIRDFSTVTALTSVTVDDNAPLAVISDAALKLYFAQKGEDLWETAKRCRTSPSLIMEENGLTSEIMQEDGMIIIPIA